MPNKPNCYNCKHRCDLTWDAHSRCNHPDKRRLVVIGNRHGIKNGWFNWPWNFDPTWVEYCDGFENKEDKSE